MIGRHTACSCCLPTHPPRLRQLCSRHLAPYTANTPVSGIPKLFNPSKTIATEVTSNDKDRITFKLQQSYTPRLLRFTKTVNSLVTLTLDENGKVKYHKDMWNDKDYSHEGLGKIMKNLNGDHLTKITQPPDSLKAPDEKSVSG